METLKGKHLFEVKSSFGKLKKNFFKPHSSAVGVAFQFQVSPTVHSLELTFVN